MRVHRRRRRTRGWGGSGVSGVRGEEAIRRVVPLGNVRRMPVCPGWWLVVEGRAVGTSLVEASRGSFLAGLVVGEVVPYR